MNHRVTLLRPITTSDAVGQPVKDWEPIPPRWANVLFQTGAEAMRANAAVIVKRCSIRINKDAAVDENWRARYQGVDYNIKSAVPDSNDTTKMFLVCESSQ